MIVNICNSIKKYIENNNNKIKNLKKELKNINLEFEHNLQKVNIYFTNIFNNNNNDSNLCKSFSNITSNIDNYYHKKKAQLNSTLKKIYNENNTYNILYILCKNNLKTRNLKHINFNINKNNIFFKNMYNLEIIIIKELIKLKDEDHQNNNTDNQTKINLLNNILKQVKILKNKSNNKIVNHLHHFEYYLNN